MTALSSQTRAEIKGYLEGFIQGLIDTYKGREIIKPSTAEEYLSRISTNGELKPFQAALIPPELIRINQFERGLSTKLGNSLEECARLIALEHHQEVRRGYDIKTEVSLAAFAEAERQKEYYAMPYNPYGATKAVYRWSQALNYLPFEEAVVIGNEFWNVVGGQTAYEELLEIYLEVGQEKGKYMLDALAFGF